MKRTARKIRKTPIRKRWLAATFSLMMVGFMLLSMAQPALVDANVKTDADRYADSFVERASDVELRGEAAADVVAVAKTQLGYEESTLDFVTHSVTNENGDEIMIQKGMTIYGASAGGRYDDWNGAFVQYVLGKAQIEEIPEFSETNELAEILQDEEDEEMNALWIDGEAVPAEGDLVLFKDTEAEERAGRIGIVSEVVEEDEPAHILVIEGDVDGGHGVDVVAENSYELNAEDSEILGYVDMQRVESAYVPEEDEEEEIVEEVVEEEVIDESEAVEEGEFSSMRLIIGTEDEALLAEEEAVISAYNGIYLLQFDSEDATKKAFMSYNGKVDFITPDVAVAAAEDEDPEEKVITTDNVYTEEANPFAELEVALEETNTEAPAKNIRRIALIDTGASVGGNVIEAVSMIGEDGSDDNGHGERMVAFIKGQDEDAEILSIKALGKDGRGDVSAVIAGINYAIEREVSIINLSLAAYASAENAALADAVRRATEAGITVVGAAGNQGFNAKYYIPGNITEAIIVGSAAANGEKIDASNFGETVDYNVVSKTTSEAAAKLTGFISANGAEAIDGALNAGLIFATDYVPAEEKEEEKAEEFEGVEAQDIFSDHSHITSTVSTWDELEKAVALDGPRTIKITKDLIAERPIEIKKNVKLVSADSNTYTIYRKSGNTDFSVFTVKDSKTFVIGKDIVMTGQLAHEEASTTTGAGTLANGNGLTISDGSNTCYVDTNDNVVFGDGTTPAKKQGFTGWQIANLNASGEFNLVRKDDTSKYLLAYTNVTNGKCPVQVHTENEVRNTAYYASKFKIDEGQLKIYNPSKNQWYSIGYETIPGGGKPCYAYSGTATGAAGWFDDTAVETDTDIVADGIPYYRKNNPEAGQTDRQKFSKGNEGFFVTVQDGDLILEGNAQLVNFRTVDFAQNAPINTAPVVVNGGTATVSGSAAISSNTVYGTGSAGAILAKGGTVNITSGSIKNNTANGSDSAAAILVNGGAVTINGRSQNENGSGHVDTTVAHTDINNNTGNAIIRVKSGSVTQNGGDIWGNTPSGTDAAPVKVEGGTYTQKNGGILDNTALGATGTTKIAGAVSVSGSGKFVLEGGVVKGNKGTAAGAIYVTGAGASVSQSGGSIMNNNSTANENSAGAIYAGTGSAVNLSGGNIKNNAAPITDLSGNTLAVGWNNTRYTPDNTLGESTLRATAGAILVDGSTLELSNASDTKKPVLSGNTGHAGAIYIKNRGTVTMKGGQIGADGAPNKGRNATIAVDDGKFNMYSGDIEYNETVQRGTVTVYGSGEMTMDTFGDLDAPHIHHNKTVNKGGAIYVDSDNVKLIRGELDNNIAGYMGGAIYVVGDSPQSTRVMEFGIDPSAKTYIYHNAAKETIWPRWGDARGGGIWFCAWSTVLYDQNRVIIDENYIGDGDSSDPKQKVGSGQYYPEGGGIDVFKTPGLGLIAEWTEMQRNGDEETEIDITNWKTQDGNGGTFQVKRTEDGFYGRADLHNTNELATGSLSSKTDLLIHDNKAPLGGGMGLNGIITFRQLPVFREIGWANLELTKTWKDSSGNTVADPSNKKVEVTVSLKDAENKINFEQTFTLEKGVNIDGRAGVGHNGAQAGVSISNGWTATVPLPGYVEEIGYTTKIVNGETVYEPTWGTNKDGKSTDIYSGVTGSENFTVTEDGNSRIGTYQLWSSPNTSGYSLIIKETVYEKANGSDDWTVVSPSMYELSSVGVTKGTNIDEEISDVGNNVTLKYTHFDLTTSMTNEDVPDQELNLKKVSVDGTNSTPLPGVGFTIFNTSGEAQGTEQTSAAETGEFSFTGLRPGTYYIEETTKPDGYKALDAKIYVEIKGDGKKELLGVVENVGVDSETGQVLLGGKPLYATSAENDIGLITTDKTEYPLYFTDNSDGAIHPTNGRIKSVDTLKEKSKESNFWIQVGDTGAYIYNNYSKPLVGGKDVHKDPFKWVLTTLTNGATVLQSKRATETPYYFYNANGFKVTTDANGMIVANTDKVEATGNNSADLEITVKNKQDVMDITVEKEWIGDEASDHVDTEVEVVLVKNSTNGGANEQVSGKVVLINGNQEIPLEGKSSTITLNDSHNRGVWKAKWVDLPVDDYRIQEVRVSGYDVSYERTEDADGNVTFKIKNKKLTVEDGKVHIHVNKVWADGNDGITEIEVELMKRTQGQQNWQSTGYTMTLNAVNNWSGTFSGDDGHGLPKFDANGNLIEYTVLENISGLENDYTVTVSEPITMEITAGEASKVSGGWTFAYAPKSGYGNKGRAITKTKASVLELNQKTDDVKKQLWKYVEKTVNGKKVKLLQNVYDPNRYLAFAWVDSYDRRNNLITTITMHATVLSSNGDGAGYDILDYTLEPEWTFANGKLSQKSKLSWNDATCYVANGIPLGTSDADQAETLELQKLQLNNGKYEWVKADNLEVGDAEYRFVIPDVSVGTFTGEGSNSQYYVDNQVAYCINEDKEFPNGAGYNRILITKDNVASYVGTGAALSEANAERVYKLLKRAIYFGYGNDPTGIQTARGLTPQQFAQVTQRVIWDLSNHRSTIKIKGANGTISGFEADGTLSNSYYYDNPSYWPGGRTQAQKLAFEDLYAKVYSSSADALLKDIPLYIYTPAAGGNEQNLLCIDTIKGMQYQYLTVTNTPKFEKRRLLIYKYDGDTKLPISGVKFELYMEDENGDKDIPGTEVKGILMDDKLVTGGDGMLMTQRVLRKNRTYYLVETTPADYQAIGTIKFTLDGSDETLKIVEWNGNEINFKDQALTGTMSIVEGGAEYDFTETIPDCAGVIRVANTKKKFDLELLKVNGSQADKPVMKKVTFDIYNTDPAEDDTAKPIATEETNKDGKIKFTGLLKGTYYLVEKTPDGFIADFGRENRIEVTIGSEGEITLVTEHPQLSAIKDEEDQTKTIGIKVENREVYKLPSTGGIGTYWNTIIGTMFLCLAGAFMLRAWVSKSAPVKVDRNKRRTGMR